MATGKSSRSCIYLFFLPYGVEIELIFVLETATSETRTDFGHETWLLAKAPEVADTYSFYPEGLKLSLSLPYLLYGQQFRRYMPIFKISIFGHEIWPLAKFPEVAHKIGLTLALQAAVSEIKYAGLVQICYS